VYHQHVPGPDLGKGRGESWAVRGGPGFPVHMDVFGRDAGVRQGGQLAPQVLLCR